LAARFGGRHAGPQIIFDVEFEMRFKFLGQFAVTARPTQQPSESR
jgi:hypothetical protein